MRTDENQLALSLNAPDDAVTFCNKSEALAVQTCLRMAERVYGRDQKTVALMCGWKSDSCLSEIARESNARRMPQARLGRFAQATGCNLVAQVRERIAAEKRAAGKPTQRDMAFNLSDLCMAARRAA